jgi:hypothetical protein
MKITIDFANARCFFFYGCDERLRCLRTAVFGFCVLAFAPPVLSAVLGFFSLFFISTSNFVPPQYF